MKILLFLPQTFLDQENDTRPLILSLRRHLNFQIFSIDGVKLGTGVLSCRCLPKSKGIAKIPLVDEKFVVVAIARGSIFD